MASLLGGIGGVSALGGLAAATTGTPTTAAGVQASTASGLSKYLNFELPWFGLFLLAGGFPFPPFSYLGLGGLNLWATGSMSYFAVKAALQGLLTIANMFIKIYYPSMWWFGYLLVLNPWYVFDIVQMFSPAFAVEGFKTPFLHSPIGNGSTGKMTPALLAMSFALMCTGAYSLLNFLPNEIQVAYKPIFNTIMLTVGGITALAGGSIGGMVVLPQLITAIKGNLNEASTSIAKADSEIAATNASAANAKASAASYITSQPTALKAASAPMASAATASKAASAATVSAPMASAATASKAASAPSLTASAPSLTTSAASMLEGMTASAPALQNINSALTTAASVASGPIPYILSAFMSGPGTNTTTGNTTTADTTAADTTTAETTMTGNTSGNAPPENTGQTGGGVPSLAEVANKILNKNSNMNITQDGGGKKDDDTAADIFLGTLAITALGGISLALIRSKAVSVGSV
jgi:hypothetical protein